MMGSSIGAPAAAGATADIDTLRTGDFERWSASGLLSKRGDLASITGDLKESRGE